MDKLPWDKIYDYYYGRRKNKVPAEYYRGKFDVISNYFCNSPITYDTLGGFFLWLDEDFKRRNKRPMSNSYRNKYLSILKVCARLTGQNIDEYKGDNESFDRRETEKLTLDEYHRLVTTTIHYKRDAEYKNFYDILLIKVAIITTQRPGNISGLTWGDYINGYLHFRGRNTPKNGRPHRVYLPPHMQDDMRKLRRYSSYIFTTDGRPFGNDWLTDMIRTRCCLAKINKNITAKSLRGTGATQYLQKYDIQKVMQITGHKSPQVLIDHYYDPQNKVIEAIIDNNPFDPEPMNEDLIRLTCQEFVTELQKRKVQANLIPQSHNLVITVPLET